jgi:hypothetical protein
MFESCHHSPLDISNCYTHWISISRVWAIWVTLRSIVCVMHRTVVMFTDFRTLLNIQMYIFQWVHDSDVGFVNPLRFKCTQCSNFHMLCSSRIFLSEQSDMLFCWLSEHDFLITSVNTVDDSLISADDRSDFGAKMWYCSWMRPPPQQYVAASVTAKWYIYTYFG